MAQEELNEHSMTQGMKPSTGYFLTGKGLNYTLGEVAMSDLLNGADLTGPLNGGDIIREYEQRTGESIVERLWRLPKASSLRQDDEERAEDCLWDMADKAAQAEWRHDS